MQKSKRIRHIHLIGIGGSGMNGIAEVLINQGYTVSGSDLQPSLATERLAKLGAKIVFGHTPENIAYTDLVIVSSAIADDNPELIAAYKARLPVLPRAQMLAELMRSYYGIAIAGTHGKTTTTSLTASILAEGGLDPTFIIGGILNSSSAYAKLGQSRYFVVEADESDASFLRLHPMIAVVSNIEADHMQTYENDFEKLRQAFLKFLHNLPFYGLAVVCNDDPVITELLPEIARPVITYGFSEEADVKAENFKQTGLVCSFKVIRKNHSPLDVILNLPGRHNVLNALAAIAVATECKVKDEDIYRALAYFKGVGRRLQSQGDFKFTNGKVTVFDDYGHHPTEIKVSLEALRTAFPNRRLVLAFQPHRYSRTQALFEDFVKILSAVDELILLEIYPAGEEPIEGISGFNLMEKVKQCGRVNPVFVEKIEGLQSVLPQILRDGDVLLLQGAGSVGRVVNMLNTNSGEN